MRRTPRTAVLGDINIHFPRRVPRLRGRLVGRAAEIEAQRMGSPSAWPSVGIVQDLTG